MTRQIKTMLQLLAGSILFGLGCVGDDASDGNVEPRDYYDGDASAALGASTNETRCATCHSDEDGKAGYSGDSLRNIAYKDSYKGGTADLRGAVNACVGGWMAGAELQAEDPEYLALVAFFEDVSDPAARTPNPLAPEVLADVAAYETAYAGGDAGRGAAKWDLHCAKCHDASITVGRSLAPAAAVLATLTIGRIAQQVRTSGPPPSATDDANDSTPGPMPFFEPDELPPADLADIVAYLVAP